MKRAKNAMLLGLGLSVLVGSQGFAQQDDPLLSETDQVVNTGQIDVEGIFQKKKAPSQADRIQALRRKLEEKHEQMMRKRVEDMRLEEEKKLARKLEKALNGQLQAMDQVQTKQAAPAKVEAQVVKSSKQKDSKVSVQAGFLSLSSSNNDFDAAANLGLEVESKVHPRVSVGVSLKYSKIEVSDVFNVNNNTVNGFQSFSNPGFINNFGLVQSDASYTQLGFGLFSKVFLTVGSKIRPYGILGLDYTRAKLGLDDNKNTNVNFNSINLQDISNNHLAGSVGIGAEINFSDMVSAGLNVKYQKALTSGLNDLSASNNYEQTFKQLALDLEEADAISINAGVSFNF